MIIIQQPEGRCMLIPGKFPFFPQISDKNYQKFLINGNTIKGSMTTYKNI